MGHPDFLRSLASRGEQTGRAHKDSGLEARGGAGGGYYNPGMMAIQTPAAAVIIRRAKPEDAEPCGLICYKAFHKIIFG